MSYDILITGSNLIETLFMKSPLLTCIVLLATGTMAHAQLSLLPQVGFERSHAALNYNSLSTSGVEGSLRANLRADYRFKGGFGPYLSVGTSPAPVSFSFNNEGTLLGGAQMSKSNLLFRMEGGYQYSSMPIRLQKNKAPQTAIRTMAPSHYSMQKRGCGSSAYRSHCGSKTSSIKKAPVDKSLNLRLQPSLGLAFVPGADAAVKQQAGGFAYNATSWKTAAVPAMGFEFGKGSQRLFTLSVFYTRPLGMDDETVTSQSGSKPALTRISPKAATWGMALGVPISLGKTKTVKQLKEVRQEAPPAPYRKCTRTIRL